MRAGSRELNVFEQLDQSEDRFIPAWIWFAAPLRPYSGAAVGLLPRSSGVESHFTAISVVAHLGNPSFPPC